MTAKEFLSRAYLLDERINAKLEQIDNLKALATKCTSTLGDERVGSSHDYTKMERIICKIIDLRTEIDNDIDYLIDIKKEIKVAISNEPNPTYRLLLEQRYLNGKEWQAIADDMHYDICHVQRLHGHCLKKFRFPNGSHKIS